MPWDDDLAADDDLTRWLAVRRAAEHGGPQHIDALLDLALHDPTEVQTVGGMAEHWEHLGDVAASSLADILARQDGLDERIRRAATDLGEDDGRVGALLCRLDRRYEPVRAALESSAEARLRLRALKGIRPYQRPPELSHRFLADPSPAVRVEALHESAELGPADLDRALFDPIPDVRKAAARRLRWRTDSAGFVAAARAETEPGVRAVFVNGLVVRPLTDEVVQVLRDYLADGGYTGHCAAKRLRDAGHPT